MKIPFIDLVGQYHSIQSEIDEAIQGVLETGHFILGPEVSALEAEVAAYTGVEHGVGVASGTDALVLALRAMDIGPGDEVIVPAYTFFATAEAVMIVGATPVFVEMEDDTYCMDVAHTAERINEKTKAIIPVHLYGHAVDMDPIMALAEKHGLKVIEDNAQAFGAGYKGRKTGSIGHVGCLSFFPTKNLGGFGDGGMVVTNDATLAQKIRMLRMHGWQKKYRPEMLGYNSRLDALQAAILRVKLRYVDQWNEGRRTVAARYGELLADLPLKLPYAATYTQHVYHLYIVRVQNRPAFQQYLKDNGVPSAVYYPIPVHLTDPCRELGWQEGDLPRTEAASGQTLAIPFYPDMPDEQMRAVADIVAQALAPVGVPA